MHVTAILVHILLILVCLESILATEKKKSEVSQKSDQFSINYALFKEFRDKKSILLPKILIPNYT